MNIRVHDVILVLLTLVCLAIVASGIWTATHKQTQKRSIVYFQDERSSICFAESNHAVTIVPCPMVPEELLEVVP